MSQDPLYRPWILNELSMTKILGSGTSCRVFEAKARGANIAVKILQKSHPKL